LYGFPVRGASGFEEDITGEEEATLFASFTIFEDFFLREGRDYPITMVNQPGLDFGFPAGFAEEAKN
jgi:hypothetical protein